MTCYKKVSIKKNEILSFFSFIASKFLLFTSIRKSISSTFAFAAAGIIFFIAINLQVVEETDEGYCRREEIHAIHLLLLLIGVVMGCAIMVPVEDWVPVKQMHQKHV
jgi:hypothetical protein